MTISFDAIAATLVSRAKPLELQSAVAAPAKNVDGESFATALTNAAESTVSKIQNAEAMSVKGIQGEANTYEVATAVMQAEQSLRMAIGVRDKMVSAYLEISRMQI